jgi:TRAP-type C4-dicarboxylate transport system permease small subunit
MITSRTLLRGLDNIESYICRALLVTFVSLLFLQIVLRQFFDYTLPWGEELATYLFVWFAFFGASYATRKAAHNRVTFQFKLFPQAFATVSEALADLLWLGFNLYFVYLSTDFVFNRMNLFWKSQTMGIPMKYIYLVLPLAFALMSLRIIQVNYLKLVKGIDVRDPERAERERMAEQLRSDPPASAGGNPDRPRA